MWIFSCRQTVSVACSQCVSESVYAACVALLFSAKMTEQLEQRYCIKFCRIAKWKPFGRFSGFSVMMPLASHKLRSGTTDSKMATCRWRATLAPVGPQQAEMTNSLTKCRLWSCRTIMSPSENLRRRWG